MSLPCRRAAFRILYEVLGPIYKVLHYSEAPSYAAEQFHCSSRSCRSSNLKIYKFVLHTCLQSLSIRGRVACSHQVYQFCGLLKVCLLMHFRNFSCFCSAFVRSTFCLLILVLLLKSWFENIFVPIKFFHIFTA